MTREELMINDIVFDYTKTPVKVCAVGQDIVVKSSFRIGSLEPNELSPIPLTEEILEKNGFEKTTNDWNRHRPLIIFESMEFPTISIHADMDMKHFWVHGTIDLTYVHQLQHLMRLCGLKKEIEL